MKSTFTIIFISLTCLSSTAQMLIPGSLERVDKHLIEVNPLWAGNQLSQEIVQFQNETERIQYHLENVINKLKVNSDYKGGDMATLKRRKELIDHLMIYQKAGKFPKNGFYPARRPVFKDHYQTSCAVAHMMEASGEEALIARIQEENNYDYLAEIADAVPEVGVWSQHNGFTVDELMLIQPSYPSAHRNIYPVGNGDGVTQGKINVMVTDGEDGLLFLAGNFTEIDGQSANSIIAWDGDTWVDMGGGVGGEILDMTYDSRYNRLFVVGDFILMDDPESRNIAQWKDGVWKGLQQGDMQGVVKTVVRNEFNLVIGGDFKLVNGTQMPYLSKRGHQNDDNGEWTDEKDIAFSGPPVAGEFAVNGPVNVLQMVEDSLLIAGNFSMTAPEADSTLVEAKEVNNVTYWFDSTFSAINSPNFNEIKAAGYVQGELFLVDSTFQDDFEVARVHKLIENSWQERSMIGAYTSSFDTLLPARIFGFVGDGSTIYTYGSVMDWFSLVNQSGFVDLNGRNGVSIDGSVSSAVIFQDQFYFGGEFTHPEGDGLISAALETGGGDATIDLELTQTIQVRASNGELHLNYRDLDNTSTFSLYDYEGKLIDTFDLEKGDASLSRSYPDLEEGLYVYQVQKGARMTAGRLSFF